MEVFAEGEEGEEEGDGVDVPAAHPENDDGKKHEDCWKAERQREAVKSPEALYICPELGRHHRRKHRTYRRDVQWKTGASLKVLHMHTTDHTGSCSLLAIAWRTQIGVGHKTQSRH